MFSIRDNKTIFWRWWLLAAAVYLLFAALITYFYGINFLMPSSDDTSHHVQLAKNLLDYGVFSLDGLDGAYSDIPPRPTNFLTPGYAFWLAFIFLIFKSFAPAIFIGALVFAFSVPLTYFLAREITGNDRIAFWSALVFMIEPLSIYHSGLIFTEQLFVPLFLAACLYFIKYIKTDIKKYLFGSLLAFSAATLIRPIIFYFLLVLVFITAIKESKISWRGGVKYGLISLVLAYSLLGLWTVRNKMVLGTWQISSNQGVILEQHYELLFRTLKSRGHDIEYFDADKLVKNYDPFSVEYNNIYGRGAMREILKHKWAYFKIHVGYVPLLFLTNGYDNILSRLTDTPGFDKFFRNDLASAFLKGDLLTAFRMIQNAPKVTTVFLIGISFWFLFTLIALAGFFDLASSKKGKDKSVIIFAGILIFYFALVISPFVVARYRLPINPFLFILSMSGFLYFKSYFTRKHA